MSNAVKFVLRDIKNRNQRGRQRLEKNYIKFSESSQLFSSDGTQHFGGLPQWQCHYVRQVQE